MSESRRIYGCQENDREQITGSDLGDWKMKQILISSKSNARDLGLTRSSVHFGFWSCVFVFLLFVGFAGCGDDATVTAPGGDELVGQGWKEYSAGNYEYAIARFQEAAEIDTDNSEALNGIGWAEARLGQVSESIVEFGKAITKDTANADAHAGLAGMYFIDGDYELAIASANSVLLLQPEYESHHDNIKAADIHILLAKCYYNTGKYAEAEAQTELVGDSSGISTLADLLLLMEELAEK